MSIVTWRKEFCTVPAEQMKDAPLEEAINHSLRKWKGLRQDNLLKHGLHRNRNDAWRVVDGRTGASHATVSSAQCALCVKFLTAKCFECPLNVSGTRLSGREGCIKVYSAWADQYTPEPMIQALEEALTHYGTQAPTIDPKPETTGREALQALTVLEAIERARKVLREIGVTGGDYGYFGHGHGSLVFDAVQAEAALYFATTKLYTL